MTGTKNAQTNNCAKNTAMETSSGSEQTDGRLASIQKMND